MISYKSKFRYYIDLIVISVLASVPLTYILLMLLDFNYDYISKNTLVVILINTISLILIFGIPFSYKIYKKLRFKSVKTNISINDIK